VFQYSKANRKEDSTMKIKKFNAIMIATLLSGALLVPTTVAFIVQMVRHSPISSATATFSGMEVIAGEKAISSAFMSEGKQATMIQWRSQRGELPGKTTLKKWTVGDRTYYEICGPINPNFRDRGTLMSSQWGSIFACEVFFERGGSAYDQWIINPNQSSILHFSKPLTGDYHRDATHNQLPDSRYQVKVLDDRVWITFWCHNSDTPRNIVFNYNNTTGTGGLNWVTMDTQKNGPVAIHHDPSAWAAL
jgi:hypothetical protein